MKQLGIFILAVLSLVISLKTTAEETTKTELSNPKCHLNPKFSYVSLSAPMTALLQEFKLFNDPSLKAISSFNNLLSTSFKGEVLGGGIFISQKVMTKYKKAIWLYDDSHQLSRLLKKGEINKTVSIKSRGKDSLQVYKISMAKLSPYLINCEAAATKLNQWVSGVISKLKKIPSSSKVWLFYLNALPRNGKKPGILMVNDGWPKLLARFNKIKTYPSSLAYVSWSQRIVNELTSKSVVMHVGLANFNASKGETFKWQNLQESQVNIYSSLQMLPGLFQIKFIDNMLRSEQFLSSL
ncbi:MAG: hypothetical protein ACOCUH_03925 [Bacteriovoracia bacterium]